jgi:hypothetical protein
MTIQQASCPLLFEEFLNDILEQTKKKHEKEIVSLPQR